MTVTRSQTMEEKFGAFTDGVSIVLGRWTALQMAVAGNWGGGDSQRKAELLKEELLQNFKTKRNFDIDAVHDFLVDFLDNEFHTVTEDGSPDEVAKILCAMCDECKEGNFSRVEALRALAPPPSVSLPAEPESEDEIDDEDMVTK